MRRKLFVSALVVCLSAGAGSLAPADDSAINVPPKGFIALFNGKDLAGWHVPDDRWKQDGIEKWQDHWTIEKGILKTYTEAKATHWVTTDRKFKDFIFMIDCTLPLGEDTSGNSGIALHGKGFLQVDFGKNRKGSGSLETYSSPHGKYKDKPEIRAKGGSPKRYDKPPKQWNTMIIILRGNRVTTIVNGHTAVEDFELLEYEPDAEGGPIGIQKHTNSHGWGRPMEFRNIFIKPLGPDEPLPDWLKIKPRESTN